MSLTVTSRSKFIVTIISFFVAATTVRAAVPGPEEPWLDAGANGFHMGGEIASRDAPVAMAGWRDAGASAEQADAALAAARWEAWKAGATMSAEWQSQKLSDYADSPFNTWLLVFNQGKEGIESITEYVRGRTPPRELASYLFMRGKDLIIVSRQQAGADDFAVPIATLVRSGDAWIAKTVGSEDTYRQAPDGGLAIDREIYGGRHSERYHPNGQAVFTNEDLVVRRGAFETKPEYGVAQWSEKPTTASDDVDYAYWFNSVKDSDLSFSIGNAEPIADARFIGLSALTAGPTGLENLAIADVVFGSTRRATPVLAWAYLGRLPQRNAN